MHTGTQHACERSNCCLHMNKKYLITVTGPANKIECYHHTITPTVLVNHGISTECVRNTFGGLQLEGNVKSVMVKIICHWNKGHECCLVGHSLYGSSLDVRVGSMGMNCGQLRDVKTDTSLLALWVQLCREAASTCAVSKYCCAPSLWKISHHAVTKHYIETKPIRVLWSPQMSICRLFCRRISLKMLGGSAEGILYSSTAGSASINWRLFALSLSWSCVGN